MEKIGHWAFLLGVALAVLAGLVPQWQTSTMVWTLAVLGLVVGILNVQARETTEFLVATITLMVVGSAGALPSLGLLVTSVLSNIVAFVAPASLVVALKALWELAQE
ncbi:MAG: hypothetical protein HY363_06255 [Candidatus Aenigmarchaeota archaeon]|nr:hypothetical protein [Candidatus Aenigmarchaeota archaeon]